MEALKPIQDKVAEIQSEFQSPIERQILLNDTPARALRLGEKVYLKSLKLEGVVTSLGEEEIEVQVGVLRMRTRMKDIRRKGEEEERLEPLAPLRKTRKEPVQSESTLSVGSPGMELDLRGQRAEDALEAMERYLESAYLSGMPFVRLIHGKGTGRLRQVIRDSLRQSSHVTRFESGGDNEGGDGVTIVHISQD